MKHRNIVFHTVHGIEEIFVVVNREEETGTSRDAETAEPARQALASDKPIREPISRLKNLTRRKRLGHARERLAADVSRTKTRLPAKYQHQPQQEKHAMHTATAPTARDIMTSHVHTVGPEMKLGDIVTFLIKHDRSNVPVVKQEGDDRILLGFVSEGDCLEYLANELFYGNPSPPQTAQTIMRRHPACVRPDTDVFTLASIFTSHRYRHLPVVQDQHLLGIVSRRDILKSLDQYYRESERTRDREQFPVDVHKIMNHRFIVAGQ